jgi:hypothetical protein
MTATTNCVDRYGHIAEIYEWPLPGYPNFESSNVKFGASNFGNRLALDDQLRVLPGVSFRAPDLHANSSRNRAHN